jgi:hypothetical protein
MKIWVLSIYDYSEWASAGALLRTVYFKTRKGAEKYAKELQLFKGEYTIKEAEVK